MCAHSLGAGRVNVRKLWVPLGGEWALGVMEVPGPEEGADTITGGLRRGCSCLWVLSGARRWVYRTTEGGCFREGVAGWRWGSTAASPRGQERTRGRPSPCPGPGYPAQPLPCLPRARAAHFFLGAKLSLPRVQRKTTGDSARPTSVFNVSCRALWGSVLPPLPRPPACATPGALLKGKPQKRNVGPFPSPFTPSLLPDEMG